MKKKSIILCAAITVLVVVGYINYRIYYYYNKNEHQMEVKNGTPSSTTDNPKPYAVELPKETTTPITPAVLPSSSTEIEIITYKKGDKGNQIAEIQKRLVKYGYELSIDGIFGNDTFNAIWDFQKRLELSLDGVIGPETLAKLNEEPTEKTKYTPPGVPVISNITSKNDLEKFLNDSTFNSSTIFLFGLI